MQISLVLCLFKEGDENREAQREREREREEERRGNGLHKKQRLTVILAMIA